MPEAVNQDHRFDIALSFAGDNKRDLVRSVAQILRAELGTGRVFFDEWFEAEIAGPDASIVLQNIYRRAARLVVTCVCRRYAEKPWTQDEWRAIQAFERSIRDAGSDNVQRMRFLPLRFGDGEVDGLFETAIVPDVRGRSPRQIANLILERLQLSKQHPASTATAIDISVERDRSGQTVHSEASRAGEHIRAVPAMEDDPHQFTVTGSLDDLELFMQLYRERRRAGSNLKMQMESKQ